MFVVVPQHEICSEFCLQYDSIGKNFQFMGEGENVELLFYRYSRKIQAFL